MSEEYRKKLAEARNIADCNGGFAAAVAHLYGPLIRRTK
jgi:hypothetical protein